MDLKEIPAPQSLIRPNYEGLLREATADLLTNIQQDVDPTFEELSESDPLLKLLEAFVYREFLLRQQVCDAIKGSLITLATGSELANLAEFILDESIDDLQKLAKINPELLRSRILAFWKNEFNTVGTAEAYRYFAKKADPRISDVFVGAGDLDSTVYIYLLSHFESIIGRPISTELSLEFNTDDQKIYTNLIDKMHNNSWWGSVRKAVLDKTVHRLGDNVVIAQGPLYLFDVQIRVKLSNGASADLCQKSILGALDLFFKDHFYFGATFEAFKLDKCIFVDGVLDAKWSLYHYDVDDEKFQIINGSKIEIDKISCSSNQAPCPIRVAISFVQKLNER